MKKKYESLTSETNNFRNEFISFSCDNPMDIDETNLDASIYIQEQEKRGGYLNGWTTCVAGAENGFTFILTICIRKNVSRG